MSVTSISVSQVASSQHQGEINIPEKLLALSAIASLLGIPTYTVRRAARNGDFPTYRIGKGRTRARLSEVLAAIDIAGSVAK